MKTKKVKPITSIQCSDWHRSWGLGNNAIGKLTFDPDFDPEHIARFTWQGHSQGRHGQKWNAGTLAEITINLIDPAATPVWTYRDHDNGRRRGRAHCHSKDVLKAAKAILDSQGIANNIFLEAELESAVNDAKWLQSEESKGWFLAYDVELMRYELRRDSIEGKFKSDQEAVAFVLTHFPEIETLYARYTEALLLTDNLKQTAIDAVKPFTENK